MSIITAVGWLNANILLFLGSWAYGILLWEIFTIGMTWLSIIVHEVSKIVIFTTLYHNVHRD